MENPNLIENISSNDNYKQKNEIQITEPTKMEIEETNNVIVQCKAEESESGEFKLFFVVFYIILNEIKTVLVVEMDTEEHNESLDVTNSSKIDDSDAGTQQEFDVTELCVSRILNATWAEFCEGSIIVPQTAAVYLDHYSSNTNDLISQVIYEIINQYFDGILVKNIESTEAEKKKEDESMETAEEGTSSGIKPIKVLPFSLSKVGALDYIVKAYEQAVNETRELEASKRTNLKKNQILETIQLIKKQLMNYSILLLDGTLQPIIDDSPSARLEKSPLLMLIYLKSVSDEFLLNFIQEIYTTDKESFEEIFKMILKNLFNDMQHACTDKTITTEQIYKLREFTSLTLSEGTVRPICNLLVKLTTFLPALSTDSAGREISKISFLAPFLSVSVFAEDNPKLAENYLQSSNIFDRLMISTLQLELDCVRKNLHTIFHALLVNGETRNDALTYFAHVLKYNEKRAQMNADEKHLAKDGFMLNVMAGE